MTYSKRWKTKQNKTCQAKFYLAKQSLKNKEEALDATLLESPVPPSHGEPSISSIFLLRSESFSYISFELLRDTVSKTENIHALSTGKKRLGYKSSCFHRLFWDLCARAVISHAIITLLANLWGEIS